MFHGEIFSGDCSFGRATFSFPVKFGQTVGEIWVRGDDQDDGQNEAVIEVSTMGRCLFNDCYNGDWLLEGTSELSLTSKTQTYNTQGRCVGDLGMYGDGWCQLSINAPPMPQGTLKKTVCGDITEFVVNVEHDLYPFTIGSHGWSDFTSFYWSKVPDFMLTPESTGFTLKHEIDAGTRITISYPENLSFNVYVIYEMEAANEGWSVRDGGYDMISENNGVCEEKLAFNGWNLVRGEVEFYSTYFGSSRKMGMWKKTVLGGHNQSTFTLPAFTKTFTGGIVVQPLDHLYYCGY